MARFSGRREYPSHLGSGLEIKEQLERLAISRSGKRIRIILK